MAAAVDRERSKFQTPPTYPATMRVLRPTCICSNFFFVTCRRVSLSIQGSFTIDVKNEWSFTFTLVYASMIYRGINLNWKGKLSSMDLRLFQRWVTEVTKFHFSHEFEYCYSFLFFYLHLFFWKFVVRIFVEVLAMLTDFFLVSLRYSRQMSP